MKLFHIPYSSVSPCAFDKIFTAISVAQLRSLLCRSEIGYSSDILSPKNKFFPDVLSRSFFRNFYSFFMKKKNIYIFISILYSLISSPMFIATFNVNVGKKNFFNFSNSAEKSLILRENKNGWNEINFG